MLVSTLANVTGQINVAPITSSTEYDFVIHFGYMDHVSLTKDEANKLLVALSAAVLGGE